MSANLRAAQQALREREQFQAELPDDAVVLDIGEPLVWMSRGVLPTVMLTRLVAWKLGRRVPLAWVTLPPLAWERMREVMRAMAAVAGVEQLVVESWEREGPRDDYRLGPGQVLVVPWYE